MAGRYKGLREETQLPSAVFASLVPITSLLSSVQQWPWAGADRHSTERCYLWATHREPGTKDTDTSWDVRRVFFSSSSKF